VRRATSTILCVLLCAPFRSGVGADAPTPESDPRSAVAGTEYHCPTIAEIRDRELSLQFDWTVDEGVTLAAILEVEELVSVSTENNGEFTVCEYWGTDGRPLRLYALPLGENCRIEPAAGEWESGPGLRRQCLESDQSRCRYMIRCG
jgi:hypothetical protein